MNRELLQQALDALIFAENFTKGVIDNSKEITAIREELRYKGANEALAKPDVTFINEGDMPEQDHGFDRTASHMAGEYVDTANQEPVAWHYHNPDYPIQDGDWVEVIFTSGQPDDAKKWTPLYTAPSKPEQEPAAIVDDEGFAWGYGIEGGRLPSGTKVYTAPQNPDVTLISEGKTWQGLTDDEMLVELKNTDASTVRLPPGFKYFARAIEAKLREKNT